MQNQQFNPLQGIWGTVSRRFLSAAFFVGFGLLMVPDVKALSGAIYTTEHVGIDCTGVDINIYSYKSDVYLDGGPAGSGSGLDDSPLPVGTASYYCKVTAPDGTLLGVSSGPVIEVRAGKFIDCYQLIDIVYKVSDPLVKGFDTTTNNGGEYKVWVSTDPTFPGGSTKTDNFKVLLPDPVNPPPPPPPPPLRAHLCVEKFYDGNLDGVYEPESGEVLIPDWQFVITGDHISSTQFGSGSCFLLLPGDYTVTELDSIEKHWVHTTSTVAGVTLAAGDDRDLFFGNVCIGAGGGKTLGFWSNKNGKALVGVDDLVMLAALNLRNADGTRFGFGSTIELSDYGTLRTWLLNGTAVNMSYMLSVQLAAMELNGANGLLTGTTVYAPELLPYSVPGVSSLGFISVIDLMAAANTELGAHNPSLATAGSTYRAYEEALKDALDDANNNLNFVEPTFNPAHCTFSFVLPTP